MLYIIIGLIVCIIVLLFIIRSHEKDTMLITDPKKEKAAAAEGVKLATDVAAVAVKSVEVLKSDVAASKASEASVIAATAEIKTEIKKASASKVKTYLEKEGYRVTELFPED